MVSFFSEVSQRYTERPCTKGEHTYNVRGDNYLVTTLERVEPSFFFGGGGGGNSAISVLPVLAGRVEDHPGTDTSGNRGRSQNQTCLFVPALLKIKSSCLARFSANCLSLISRSSHLLYTRQ